MSQENQSIPILSLRRFLIILGIFFGATIAGLAYIKQIGIKAINKFRIRSVKQNPVFDTDTWKLMIDGLLKTSSISGIMNFFHCEQEVKTVKDLAN